LGILNSLIYGQSLAGALFITFGLGILGNHFYFMILSATGILAFLICYFLLDPIATND
jgi:predicted permease